MNRNNKILVGLLTIMIVTGLWLVMAAPGRLADKHLVSIKAEMAQQLEVATQFEGNFSSVSKWYKPEYLAPIFDLFVSGKYNLNQAELKIKAAEAASKLKQKKAESAEAKKLIQASRDAIADAASRLSVIEKMTNDSRQLLDQLLAEVKDANQAYDSASLRLNQEGGLYLSKYVAKETKQLATAKADLSEVAVKMDRVSGFLPAAESTGQAGDPRPALELLTATRQIVNSTNATISQVIGSLNFYGEAQAKAASTTTDAKLIILSAKNHLGELISRGPLSADKALKNSYVDIEQAEQLAAAATQALETIVENDKRDLPLAFEKSYRAYELANGAIREADRQMALAGQINRDGVALESRITDFSKEIERARQYRKKLELHASSTWSSVAGNIKQANGNRLYAQESLTRAKKIATEDQAYDAALAEITNGNSAIAQGYDLLQAFINQVDILEGYRSNWPALEKRAKKMIDDNEDEVDKYGSYSSSAKSDFDSAEDSLRKAQSEARGQCYETANRYAKEAYQLADGTGDKAKKAYDDDQSSQSSSSSSFSFDSGSSSSGGSSSWGGSDSSSSSSSWGGSSDSGGYSSSSSGSDGGGYSSSSSGSDGGGW